LHKIFLAQKRVPLIDPNRDKNWRTGRGSLQQLPNVAKIAATSRPTHNRLYSIDLWDYCIRSDTAAKGVWPKAFCRRGAPRTTPQNAAEMERV